MKKSMTLDGSGEETLRIHRLSHREKMNSTLEVEGKEGDESQVRAS